MNERIKVVPESKVLEFNDEPAYKLYISKFLNQDDDENACPILI